jgi:hypothetical protein
MPVLALKTLRRLLYPSLRQVGSPFLLFLPHGRRSQPGAARAVSPLARNPASRRVRGGRPAAGTDSSACESVGGADLQQGSVRVQALAGPATVSTPLLRAVQDAEVSGGVTLLCGRGL